MSETGSTGGGLVGPNGEKVSVSLGSKTIGIAARDLMPILQLVVFVVGGVIIYDNMSKVLDRIEASQQRFQHSQYQALHDVQTLLSENQQSLKNTTEYQTELVRRWLLTLEFNLTHAAPERIPMEFDPSTFPLRK